MANMGQSRRGCGRAEHFRHAPVLSFETSSLVSSPTLRSISWVRIRKTNKAVSKAGKVASRVASSSRATRSLVRAASSNRAARADRIRSAKLIAERKAPPRKRRGFSLPSPLWERVIASDSERSGEGLELSIVQSPECLTPHPPHSLRSFGTLSHKGRGKARQQKAQFARLSARFLLGFLCCFFLGGLRFLLRLLRRFLRRLRSAELLAREHRARAERR